MPNLSADVTAALATLRSRWGAAAPQQGVGGGQAVGEVVGALATAPLPSELPPEPAPRSLPAPQGVISTGFPALDAILGTNGVPRSTSLALRGAGGSGKTTLALRLAAEAQAAGSIVAWLDLGRAFDPLEAVARGVRSEWLVVVTPHDLDEAWSIAAALLSGRSVDVLVVDLPSRLEPARDPAARPARIADRIHRLTALARRTDTLLVLLEPPSAPAALGTAVGEAAGLRLELARSTWIRLGRDVVGQRTSVVVARNRAGPPGRRAELRILYADGGERDACLLRDELLRDATGASAGPPTPIHAPAIPVPGTTTDAIAPPLLAPSSPGPGPRPLLRLVAGRPRRPRRTAVDGRPGDRRQRGGAEPRRAAGDPARGGTPARP
jgi:RecA/RadA recombinase